MSASAFAGRLARSRGPEATAFAGLFGSVLLGFLPIGAVLPILPKYVHGPLGAGDVAVGVVMGAFAFSAVVSRPIAGRLSDELGRRRVVVVGLVLIGVAGFLQLIHLGVAGLVGARLVLGWGEGWAFTAGATWIIDLAPPARRAQAIGMYGLAVWGGLSVGPVVGEALYALGSYDLVFVFAGVSPLIGALCARKVRDTHAPEDVDAREEKGPLIPHAVRLPGAALALANVGYGTMVGFLVLHLSDRGIAHGAAAFTAFATAVVLSRVVFGRVPDRIGPGRAATGSFALEAVGLALIALAQTWIVAAVGSVVMGVGFALLFPSLATLVVERTSDARRGRAMGTLTAFFDVGVGVGAPLAGAISALAGYGTAFWVAAGLAVVGALLGRGDDAPHEQCEVVPAPSPV